MYKVRHTCTVHVGAGHGDPVRIFVIQTVVGTWRALKLSRTTTLTLSLPKANLTKSRKLLNPELSNEI